MTKDFKVLLGVVAVQTVLLGAFIFNRTSNYPAPTPMEVKTVTVPVVTPTASPSATPALRGVERTPVASPSSRVK